MMRSSSLGSYKIRGVFNVLREYKSKSMTGNNPSPRNVAFGAARPRSNVFGNHAQLAALRLVHVAANSSGGRGNDRKQSISSSSPKLPSPRPGFPIWVSGLIAHNFRWAKLILGSAISLLLAVWTPKWATLLKLGGEAEAVIKEVEQAAEVMEKVAAVVEKASEEVAEELPDGNKLKEMALIIDHISKEAAKDAEIVDEILHKLDDVEKDVEEVEEMVEPLIDKIGHGDKSNETT